MDNKRRRNLYLDHEEENIPRTTRYRLQLAQNAIGVNDEQPDPVENNRNLQGDSAAEINLNNDNNADNNLNVSGGADDTDDEDSEEEADDNSMNDFPIGEQEDQLLLGVVRETIDEATSISALEKILQSEAILNVIETPIAVSQGEILCMFLKYAIFHSLSHTAVTDLFKGINCMFAAAILPDTRYLIDKLFFSTKFVRYHAICSYCGMYGGTFDRSDSQRTCTACEKVIMFKDKSFTTFYATFNIKDNIKQLLEGNEDYYNHIMEERVSQPGIFQDIYDGKEYQEFVKNLDCEDRKSYATLTFNSDGAPKFKSDNFNMYPVQAILNETPMNVRVSQPIVCAMWFGRSKPDMNVFLKGFVDHMNEISKSGVPCNIKGKNLLVKPYAICCCVDSIARAPMQGVKQCNGHYGCNWCLHEGEWVPNAQKTGGCVKFPITDPLPKNRTEEHFLQCMDYVFNSPIDNNQSNNEVDDALINEPDNPSSNEHDSPNNEPEDPAHSISNSVDSEAEEEMHSFGVLHMSPLNNLEKFKMISGFTPDDMHLARLGIGEQFLNYWSHKRSSPLKTVFTSENITEINKILEAIQVPNQAMRLTRTLSDRSNWKAKEWENWILYYSLPIISLFLDEKVVEHWALFVEAFYISLKTSITVDELKRIEYLVKKFMLDTEKYYTKSAMTYNVHQLLHWVQSLSDWGPSWSHTAFAFESYHRTLLQMIKSAKGVTHQICRQLSNRQSDLILTNHILPGSSLQVKNYCSHFREKQTQNTCKIGPIRYFGVPRRVEQSWKQELQLSNEAVSYKKMVKDKCVYSTKVDKKSRSNNTFALLKNGSFVQIKNFIVDQLTDEQYTICNLLRTENAYLNSCTFMKKVETSDYNPCSINTDEIEKICIFFTIRDSDYICPLPNMFYF